MYSQALKETDYEYDTLRHDKRVAESFKIGRRRPKLTWSHHYETASLEQDDQDKLLTRAENDKEKVWSTRVSKKYGEINLMR